MSSRRRVFVGTAAQAGEQIDDFTAGQVRPQTHIPGNISNVPVRGDRVGPRIHAEHAGRTRGGADQSQKDPQGGGFPGTVGAQETVDLARQRRSGPGRRAPVSCRIPY